MAFTYNEQEQESKSNIFGGGQPDPAMQQTGTQPGQTPGEQQKTSIEGSLAGTSQSAVDAQAKPVESTKPDTQSQRLKAISRGAERQEAPVQFGQIGQSLKQSQQQLQSEADRYMAKQTQPTTPRMSTEQIEKGVEFGGSAFKDLESRFNAPTRQAEAFKPTDVIERDAGLLESSKGISEMQRRAAGGQYSKGEEAFGRMLLARSPKLREQQRQLAEQQRALVEQSRGMETDLQSQAQAAIDRQAAEEQDYLRSSPEAIRGRMDAQNLADAQAENFARQNLDLGSIGGDALGGVRSDLMDDYANNPFLQRYIESANIDPSQYVTRGANVTADQMIDANEAERFNRIISLLGEGGQISASQPLSDRYTTDLSAMQDALRNQAQSEADTRKNEILSRLDEIEAAGLGRTDEFNLQREAERRELAQRELDALAQSMGYDAQVFARDNLGDPLQFITGGRSAQGSYITPEMGQEFQSLVDELGIDRASVFDRGALGTFDRGAARAAIRAGILNQPIPVDASRPGTPLPQMQTGTDIRNPVREGVMDWMQNPVVPQMQTGTDLPDVRNVSAPRIDPRAAGEEMIRRITPGGWV